jgi:O-methyltransferase
MTTSNWLTNVRNLLGLDRHRGTSPEAPPTGISPPTYCADDLIVRQKNTAFMREPRFVDAYARGMNSGHKIGRERGSTTDIHIEWRVHVLCWAASQAAKLPGDFVECGVNTGIFSLAVANYIDFNSTGKRFYLFDTFAGIPDEQITDRERALGRGRENEAYYEECYQVAIENFAAYPNAHLVRGPVPDTLTHVSIDRVCYLSIDMNIVAPEIAALRHFWPKLTPGAPVILDDYGWLDYVPQKEAIDEFAESVGCKVLTLPTGQGLLLKPPSHSALSLEG